MADAWYYVNGGKSAGPVSLQQLKAILPTRPNWKEELVWAVGQNDWTEAGTVAALAPVPPPLPIAKTKVMPGPQQPKSRSSISKGLLAVGGFIFIVLAAAFGKVVGREGVRALMQPSQADVDRKIEESLTEMQRKTRATLPQKLDELTTFVDVTFSGKVISYFYVIDDINYDILPNFVALVKKETIGKSCKEKSMTNAMAIGFSYRYFYRKSTNDQPIGSFEVTQADCSRV